jgi:putative flippase GtrA
MKELLKKYRELIIYIIVGGLTTIVNWAVYAAGVRLFGWSITVSNIIAWIAAVAFAYVTNKVWVFLSYDWSPRFVLREASLFVGARLATGLFEIVSVPLLVRLGLDQQLFGVKGMWSKVIVSVVVTILNYVFSKLIIFRRTS